MEKLKMHTTDFTDENIAKIAALFPNCVTESRDENGELKRAIDFDLLKQELSGSIVEGRQERYHLDWVGKSEALLTANAPIAKTLRPCREESVDFDTTKNLYIEGDNLDALKLLQETYLGKVKMIYIDPPYNTGRNLIYRNDFSEDTDSFLLKSNQEDETGNKLVSNPETNGRFHSDYLSMIYSRLKLSRNLLRDNGIIAIAIDHNELNTLISLADEVFGTENRLGIITVVHKPEGRQFANFFSPSNEFMVVYAKNKDSAVFEDVVLDSEKEKKFNFNDGTGNFKLKNFIRLTDGKYSLRENKPDGFYPIYVSPDLKSFSVEHKPDYLEALPITNKGVERVWKTSPKTFLEKVADDLIIAEIEDGKVVLYEKLPPSQVLVTHWVKKEYHSYHFGTKLLEDLLKAKTFDFPKSINLIIDILKITTSSDDIVLDFFSGSATTAHAVMQLNAEDGGNRQFIMVQLPEATDEKSEAFKAGYKTIAEIGKERIRRAGKKIKAESPLTTENLDTGFRVLKVDTSNMKDVYYAPDRIEQASLLDNISNVKEDRTDEDLLFQILLDWGVDLSVSIAKETINGKTVWLVDETAVLACFETGIDENFVKELAKRQPLRAVFRDAGFADDNAKINVEQIFKLMSPSTEVKTI